MFRRISFATFAFLGISFLVLAIAGGYYLVRPAPPSRNDPEVVRLHAQADSLAEFSDKAVADLEVRQHEAEGRLSTLAENSKFLDDLRESWNIQSLGRVDSKYIGIRRFMLTNKNQRFRGGSDRQWSDIVGTVRAIDEHPGFVPQSIVINSSVNQGLTYGQVSITVATAARDDAPPAVPVPAAGTNPPPAKKSFIVK